MDTKHSQRQKNTEVIRENLHSATLPTNPHSPFLLHSLSLPVLVPDKTPLPLGSVGFKKQKGSVQVWARMQITITHCFSAPSLSWDSHWIEMYHFFGEFLFFFLTEWRSLIQNTSGHFFLRITHKPYLRTDSHQKTLLLSLVHSAQKQHRY